MTATKGLGTYGNAVGTVTPLDHKMAQLGLIVKTGANTIRTGLFWDGNSGNIVTGTANMSYNVRAFSAVLSRSSTAGAVLLTNDATYNVATTAAPGSNSRYDVVYVWQREYSLDGTDSNPVIGVVQGTAAASPTVPSLAAFPGAISLAQILVPAGVTATNSGTTITQTATFTAAAGGTVAVRSTTERDAGSWVDGQLVYVIGDDRVYRWSGLVWELIAGKPYGFSRTGSDASVANATETTMTGSPTQEWTADGVSSGSGVVTVTYAGLYDIGGFAQVQAAGASSYVEAKVTKNGTSTVVARSSGAGNGSAFAMAVYRKHVMLAAGDTIRLRALQSTGASNTIQWEFQGVYLGPGF